jgi:hypothetical protein
MTFSKTRRFVKDKYNPNIDYTINASSKNVNRRNITETITNAVIDYYCHKRWACHREIGLLRWGKLRVDVFAFNLGGDFVGIEVKSSKADFNSDHKMSNYLKYFDKFYIACPLDIKDYILERLPSEKMGVFCLGTDGYLWCVKPAKNMKGLKNKKRRELLLRLAFRSSEYSPRTRKRRTRRFYDK